MPALRNDIDPEGLQEFSVVFTDRSLNHMSQQFQQVMRDISSTLKQVYNADAIAVVPGGGTFGMEAIARQFAGGKKCLVIRNGWFSYRWTQILEMGQIPSEATVLKASRTSNDAQAPFAPAAIDQVVATILEQKPEVVFAPHVETASGIILPDDYIRQIGDAVHQVGGLLVLDCVASGTVWVDMKQNNVDVLLSAPQKGWSASPCSALVMMSDRAVEKMNTSESSSFAANLKQWRQIMEAYENGGHAYHATLPTDALKQFRDTMKETEQLGWDNIKQKQQQLGQAVRELFAGYGIKSVAAEGFEAPGVAVFYTSDDAMKMGKPFMDQGLQVAAGVPLMCDEGDDYKAFRIGLFGLDKLADVPGTVARLKAALDKILR